MVTADESTGRVVKVGSRRAWNAGRASLAIEMGIAWWITCESTLVMGAGAADGAVGVGAEAMVAMVARPNHSLGLGLGPTTTGTSEALASGVRCGSSPTSWS